MVFYFEIIFHIKMGQLLNEVRTFLRQFSLAPLIQQLS